MMKDLTTTEKTAGGGGLAGGIAGFLFAGPVGALVGAAVGSGLGYLLKDAFGAGSVTPALKPSPFSPPAPKPTQGMAGLTVVQKPVVAQPPVTAADDSSQKTAALAMNNALGVHGYKKSDQPLYMAFQRVAGLTSDGLPGKVTMNKLATVLLAAGVPMADVKIYPWLSTGGYDGTNAPTVQDWIGDSSWSGPPPVVAQAGNPVAVIDHPSTLPTASQIAAVIPIPIPVAPPPTQANPVPVAPLPVVSTNQDVQRALNQLKIPSPLLVADGVIGPLSQAAVKKFQGQQGLTVDGIPGPITKGALSRALAAQAIGV